MSKEFEDKVIKCFENIDKRFESIDKKFDKIDEKFDKIDERFEKIDERFQNVENILQNHTNILDEHTKQINNLHESVIAIENKVMTEFPALLEAFELHQEMHEDLNEKIAYLSVKTEENSIRISALEDKIKCV